MISDNNVQVCDATKINGSSGSWVQKIKNKNKNTIGCSLKQKDIKSF